MKFSFSSNLKIYNGEKATWFFASLPKEESEQIKFFSKHMRKGFGSVRVEVEIGSTKWKTSVFPDSKSGVYVLPVKAEIRKNENLKDGDDLTIMINCYDLDC